MRTFTVTNTNAGLTKAVRAYGGLVVIGPKETETVKADFDDYEIARLEGHGLEIVEIEDEEVEDAGEPEPDPTPEPEPDPAAKAEERKQKALAIMRGLPLESFTEDKSKPKTDPINAQMHPMEPITAAERDEWWAIIEAEKAAGT